MASLECITYGRIVLIVMGVMLSGKFGYSSYVVNDFQNTDNLTEIQVWACHLSLRYELRIVDVPMTWPEAMTVCQDLGYQTIQCGLSRWLTRQQVKRYLEFINYKDLNYTFWTGMFRPYHHVIDWYQNWGSGCQPFTTPFSPSGDYIDGRCSVIQRVPGSSPEYSVIDECTKEYPFVCFLGRRGVSYQSYQNFDVNILTLGIANLKTTDEIYFPWDIDDATQCLEYCDRTSTCNGFTYDYTNISQPTCIFILGSDFYYNLTSTMNMIHYAKSDCSLFINNSFAESVSNRTFASFSDCNVDEVPESYYPCEPGCSVHQNWSVVPNKVSRKSTSNYQRTIVSSMDSRTSATSLGVVGIIIIILFGFTFPLCDKVIPKKSVKRAKHKVKKKSAK